MLIFDVMSMIVELYIIVLFLGEWRMYLVLQMT